MSLGSWKPLINFQSLRKIYFDNLFQFSCCLHGGKNSHRSFNIFSDVALLQPFDLQIFKYRLLKYFKPSVVAHICNPSTLGGRGRWIMRSGVQNQPGQDDETVSTKNTKLNLVWWWAPAVPATQEAKARESLEPERQRWQRADRATALQPWWRSETVSKEN